jgi:hypothetical protein
MNNIELQLIQTLPEKKKDKWYDIYERINLKCDIILNKLINRKKKAI